MSSKWTFFTKTISEDKELSVWHLALLLAIMQLGIEQNQEQIIRVSRSKLMQKSHINTIPTYHKYFKELQDLGYIKYTPSNHPKFRSFIELLK